MNNLSRFLYHGSVILTIAAVMMSQILPVFAMGKEVTSERSYSSKTFDYGSKKKTVFHQKWIHYLDENGEWKDIQTELKDNGKVFFMDSAPFSFSAPKSASGIASFSSTNRYDIFEDKKITEDPFTENIQAVGVKDVSGQVVTFNPDWIGSSKDDKDQKTTFNDAVVYPGAYPSYNGDLIYWVNFAAAPRLDKLVRFNSEPETESSLDLRVAFRLNFSDPAVFQYFSGQLTPGLKAKAEQKMKDMKNIADSKEYLKKVVEMRQIMRTTWTDKTQSLKTTGDLSILPTDSAAGSKRGIGMREFFVWDSGKDGKLRKEKITVEFTLEDDGSVLMTKIIPRDFLKSAQYPVYTDATSTFYPDADVESTSVDGISQRESTNAGWSNLRSGAGTFAADNDAELYLVYLTSGTDWSILRRAMILFDTSALGSGASISAATINLRGTSPSGDSTSQGQSLNFVSASPASNTAIATGDYAVASFGSTRFLDSDQSLASMSTSGYQTFTLNSSGLSNIATTGVSKFGVRFARDIDNSEPTLTSNASAYWAIRAADYSGTGSDPYLSVTYTDSTVPEFSNFMYIGVLLVCGWFLVNHVRKIESKGRPLAR